MKEISTRVQSKENRAIVMVILVRKRSAVMQGLGKFLRKRGCHYEA